MNEDNDSTRSGGERPDHTNWPLYNLLSVVSVGGMVIIGMATNTISTQMLLEIGKQFGLPGIILVLWYATNRTNQKSMQQYHNDVLEMRQMYNNNVSLVHKYINLSSDLKDVLIMNTQAITQVCNDIGNNKFCPLVRRPEDKGGNNSERSPHSQG